MFDDADPSEETDQSVIDANPTATADPSELPPVTPPSAGFIVQLFVVPAIIVAGIIGVWLLFGAIASGEQDWQKLVQDLRSENDLRRWRAAHGLAQMLQSDQRLGDDGQQLAANPKVSGALAELLTEQLGRSGSDEDLIKNQTFLAGTLGFSDRPEIALPPLERAASAEFDTEVRKVAIASIAKIAGRAREANKPLSRDETVRSLITASKDGRELIRSLAAFTLGLFESSEAEQRLLVMLEDPADEVRANAAIGLARQGLTAGFDVFRRILADAAETGGREIDGLIGEELEQARLRESIVVKNSLKAVAELSQDWTGEQRETLTSILKTLANDYRVPDIRSDAETALEKFGD